jgi:N-acetyl-gamma-glutamylphosphate reductase
VYARLNDKGLSLQNPEQVLEAAYSEAYGQEVFISYGSATAKPGLLSLKKVVGTPKAHIAYSIVDNKVYVFCAIDNLLKGAASQAIESFNAWMDIPHASGLSQMRGQA